MKIIDVSTPKFPNTFAMVDDEEFERLNRWKWSCRLGRRGTMYAYRCERGQKRQTIMLHRFIIAPPDDKFVDHINGNGLDNRRENLRICSHAENSRNISGKVRPGMQFKGTRREQRSKKFGAVICVNQKDIYLGSFDTEYEAAVAYNAAAIKHHGEFARINDLDLIANATPEQAKVLDSLG